MVDRLPSIINSDRICDLCILGKQHKDAFQIDKSWRVRRLLKIIYSDLCNMKVSSNVGCKYFITFIDDFSRKAKVYFLK